MVVIELIGHGKARKVERVRREETRLCTNGSEPEAVIVVPAERDVRTTSWHGGSPHAMLEVMLDALRSRGVQGRARRAQTPQPLRRLRRTEAAPRFSVEEWDGWSRQRQPVPKQVRTSPLTLALALALAWLSDCRVRTAYLPSACPSACPSAACPAASVSLGKPRQRRASRSGLGTDMCGSSLDVSYWCKSTPDRHRPFVGNSLW